jgi:hypothetical protein
MNIEFNPNNVGKPTPPQPAARQGLQGCHAIAGQSGLGDGRQQGNLLFVSLDQNGRSQVLLLGQHPWRRRH